MVRVMVFNATFNNISVISCRSVILVAETGEPGENHRPYASHLESLTCSELNHYLVLMYKDHPGRRHMHVCTVILYAVLYYPYSMTHTDSCFL